MITIVDYGMGNLGSVANMLKKCGVQSIITSDIEKIAEAEKIILPGVGAFDTAIKRIDELGLREILGELALVRKIPFLGICLGMQLLMESSEEGCLNGLGFIKGKAMHFRKHIQQDLKVPHMGWNEISFGTQNPMLTGFSQETRFYFVHSYFVKVLHEEDSLMKCFYGIDFDAAVCRENVIGVQFHPEKSHRFGLQFFKNFALL